MRATQEIARTAQRAPILSVEVERECIRRVQEEEDERALETLMSSHLRLVVQHARRYVRYGVPFEDLVSEGSIGLIEAARRFDLKRANRFSTYAAWWVRALMRRYAIANRRIVRAPTSRVGRRLLGNLRRVERELTQSLGAPPSREQLADALDADLADVDAMLVALDGRDRPVGTIDGLSESFEPRSSGLSPEEDAGIRELSERCVAAVGSLAPREQIVAERRLMSVAPDTLEDIGKTMGLSRERVRQIEVGVRKKLQAAAYDRVA